MRTLMEVKKLKSGYKVFFDDDTESILIEQDIYFKFHLKPGLTIDEKTYQKMVSENNELFYMRLGILKLKRMQTEKELYTYLVEKGCSKSLALKLISYYKDKKYLNDEEYAKIYVEFKKHQQGPSLLKSNLEKKGIDQDIVNQAIQKVDQEEILEKLILKKISTNKNKTKKQLYITTKTYFLSKGFQNDLIDSLLNQAINDLKFDETDLLNKTFDQIYHKLKDKKSGYELKALIKQKLYQKGFSLTDIENIFIDKDVLS